MREWLVADVDGCKLDDKTLAAGVACDDIGCTARLADGRLVVLAKAINALEEDGV